jgi:endoglucanase
MSNMYQRSIRALCLMSATLLSCQLDWSNQAVAAPTTISKYIKVDQFGYLPRMRKIAIVVDPQAGFNAAESFAPSTGAGQYVVRRWADDVAVLTGTLTVWNGGITHAQSGDRGWYFDFTALNTPGSYYIYDTVNGAASGKFEINSTVYDVVLKQAIRTYFYQRLNQAKVAPYAQSPWLDPAPAFGGPNQDYAARSGLDKTNAATAKDLSGGWMDAGDTNKYTTFAEPALIQLLDAYRFNPTVFGDNLNIPESGNGLPDLLDEVKWELDFLKRMQNATGTNGLFLKVGVDNFNDPALVAGDSRLSLDTRPRYYVGECTSATLAGSAMFAAAAVVYRAIPSQQVYGDDLLVRAEAAWNRAKSTTVNFGTFQTTCDSQDIKAGDADNSEAAQKQSALIAAVNLYEATSNQEYKTYVESHYQEVQPISNGWWGPYTQSMQVALLRFAGMPGVTAAIATYIRNQKIGQNGTMSINDYNVPTDLYRAFMPDAEYNWGSNSIHASVGNLNLDFRNFNLNTANATLYREVADQHLHWLHGANPLGLVMLSNMDSFGAESSLNEIYHAWFTDLSQWDNAKTSLFSPVKGPAPGYLSGGPNKNYGIAPASGTTPGIADQPPQKAYKDWNGKNAGDASYAISEPSISYQAAYIQLLARIIGQDGGDSTSPTKPAGLASSAITSTSATLTWQAATDNVGVTGYDVYNGTTLVASNVQGATVALTTLLCGTSNSLTVRARDAAGNYSVPSNAFAIVASACPTVATLAYTDALELNWADWSYTATRNFLNTTPIKVGAKSVRVDYGAFGGLSLRHTTGIAMGPTSKVRFWAYSAVAATVSVYVQTEDGNAESGTVNVALPAGVWTDVQLTRAQLGNPNRVKRVSMTSPNAAAMTVYFDQIQVTIN